MAPATRLRLFYFLYYGNVGAWLPYFSPYLRGLGFSGEQIGLVQMAPSLLAPAVAVAWASWADHRGSPARALGLAASWASLAVVLLPFARTPWQVAAVVVLMAIGDRAVVPLADSVTIEWTLAHPGTSYARIRLFGSIGFIVLSIAMGRALTMRGSRPADLLVPLAMVFCVAGYGLAARRAPPSVARVERPAAKDLLALARDGRLHLVLAAASIHWAACAPYHLFFGVFVRDLGLPPDVTGIGMGVGVVAEIGALLAFPRLERRLPLRALFAIAFLGSAVRWAVLSRATGAVPVAALQAFHGLTFGLFWGSAMRALADLVPARLRATGQAVFTAVAFGGGNAAGYALSGIGYDRLGGVGPLFGFAAAGEIASLALVLLPLRRATPPPAPDSSS